MFWCDRYVRTLQWWGCQGTVLPKPITCRVVETYHVRCCRNLSRTVLPKRTRFIPEGGIYVSTFLITERLVPGDRHNHI